MQDREDSAVGSGGRGSNGGTRQADARDGEPDAKRHKPGGSSAGTGETAPDRGRKTGSAASQEPSAGRAQIESYGDSEGFFSNVRADSGALVSEPCRQSSDRVETDDRNSRKDASVASRNRSDGDPERSKHPSSNEASQRTAETVPRPRQEEPENQASTEPSTSVFDPSNGTDGHGNTSNHPAVTIDLQPKYMPSGNNRSKSSKNRQSRRVDPNVLAVRREIQMSCKHNDLANAIRVYDKARADGVKIEPQTYYSLLNLCDGMERAVHIGTPRTDADGQGTSKDGACKNTVNGHGDNDNHNNGNGNGNHVANHSDNVSSTTVEPVSLEQRRRHASRIKQQMDDAKLPLTEACYTALTKVLSRSHRTDEAMAIVEEAENVQQCKAKLRLYSPLLSAYCEMNNIVGAMKTWLKIVKQPRMMPGEREYIGLLNCATNTGHASVIEYVTTCVADEVPVPSKEFVKAIVSWFGTVYARYSPSVPMSGSDCSNSSAEGGHIKEAKEVSGAFSVSSSATRLPVVEHKSEVAELLRQIRQLHEEKEGELPPTMGPVVLLDSMHCRWRISSACTIDTSTGVLQGGCLSSCRLKPCYISDRAWRTMLEMNETIVREGEIDGANSKFQGGRKGKKRRDLSNEERQRHWSRYTDFLERKFPDSVEVVIDGANVGYFETNFAGAPKHVDYQQIDSMVRHFLAAGRSVLMFLHERHFSRYLLPAQYEPITRQWHEWGVLYRTPTGMNDDWFWMHAALKYRSLVVTNDEMRDHHFQMLAPRTFLRWKDRKQVRFGLVDWVKSDTEDSSLAAPPYRMHRRIDLTYPEVYSRRMQRVEDGLAIPLTKRGDENRFLDGGHVASDDEPVHETYLCVRPCTSSEDEAEGR